LIFVVSTCGTYLGLRLAVRAAEGQKLAGKVAVVTSGSRGIATATGKGLIADGASVAITYTKGGDAAASVIKEIERAGGKAIAIQADAGANLTGDVIAQVSCPLLFSSFYSS
jgi:NAD(P)-dependent dehydrogenase (short-subunit alcohol dehydrogenase family)